VGLGTLRRGPPFLTPPLSCAGGAHRGDIPAQCCTLWHSLGYSPMVLTYSHIVDYSLPTSPRDHNTGWAIPTFRFPEKKTPEESDDVRTLPDYKPLFSHPEAGIPLFSLPFLRIHHLRTAPFLTFLAEAATLGGPGPYSCPTVKRVVILPAECPTWQC